MCEQPGIYVLNTTSLEWTTDYVPDQEYKTPELLKDLIGGQGSSNSTGGNGWQGTIESYTATVTDNGAVPTVSSATPESATMTITQSGGRTTVTKDGVVTTVTDSSSPAAETSAVTSGTLQESKSSSKVGPM